jgi:hypothetical protein
MKIKLLKRDEGFVEDELSVGDGVTIMFWSDRVPATVIEIDPKGKWIKIQRDKAVRSDDGGMSDIQYWDISRDENGHIDTFYKTRYKKITLFTDTGHSTRGKYGCFLNLKVRDKYYDYSF